MGEIAEMMLDGFMCEQCGEIIGDMETGEGQGFPGLCGGCAAEQTRARPSLRGTKTISCPNCKRRFGSEAALNQHSNTKHSGCLRLT